MENYWLHMSGVNSKLYNVAIKSLPLSLWIFIWASPVFFAVMKLPSANPMYLSAFTNKPGTIFEISGVMCQFAPENKIQLVGC